ncbi:NUDIX domain-containing protein [Hyphobacterium marinum]|uniref:NUDIX domain-containing protein n=1 Tax=Hyphobacterium marinum TaxID=3116574 RepID=A0ABU7M0S3_9PROT|nr:NUDIX domain-containing protein [Hyphobacterium sp. Y6023]MEE2567417.1 NUDIX domain-containing protein [Hyphobacterium sp. Y6023]
MSLRVKAEPVLRPLMQAWWRVRRPMTMGVRALVENDAGHVLLVRHTYVDGWFFPGGGIERGETAEDALVKELAEEAGIAPTAPPDLFGIYSNERVFRGDHVLLYRVRHWQVCGGEKAGEIAETGWFDPYHPPEGITGGTQRRLREVFSGEARTSAW